MFLFLVHMLFADTHQGHQTTHSPLSQDKRGHPPFKKKKLTWIYILKGLCQVRSIHILCVCVCVCVCVSYSMASFSKQQLLPISDARFAWIPQSVHCHFMRLFLWKCSRQERWIPFEILNYHISSLYIYIFVYIFTYILYICVCKYSYIKDFC